jgi:glutamate racemase
MGELRRGNVDLEQQQKRQEEINIVARDCNNAQATAIEMLQKQFKDQMIINGVLQNAVLKMQNKKKPGRPKKGEE